MLFQVVVHCAARNGVVATSRECYGGAATAGRRCYERSMSGLQMTTRSATNSGWGCYQLWAAVLHKKDSGAIKEERACYRKWTTVLPSVVDGASFCGEVAANGRG